MGNYTSFWVTVMTPGSNQVITSSEELKPIDEYLESTEEYPLSELDWSEWGSCYTSYQKWYEVDEDMKRISKKFPLVVFQVEGLPDGDDGKWRSYYYNGEQVDAECTVTYSKCPW